MSVRKVVLGDHEIVTTDTDEAAGRTFLLVHGIGMGISYFAQLSSELESYGRVVAIDLPGFGDAAEPEAAMTMAQMGALLIEFVEEEKLDRPVLVGHSMGTQVVAEPPLNALTCSLSWCLWPPPSIAWNAVLRSRAGA